MRDFFLNYGALMAAAWFAQKRKQQPQKNKKQVLKSRRIEDEIYRQMRSQNSSLDKIRQDYESKLPVIENLSRDMFQSLYSLDVRHYEQSELSPQVRRFNRHILNEVMKSPDYPAMKSICDGRSYPAMEAAAEFMEQVAGKLDELLAAANGDNNALNALETQEQRQAQQLQELQQLSKEEDAPTPALKKKLLQSANRLHSKEQQVEYLNQAVKDNLAKSKQAQQMIADALSATRKKAEEIDTILHAWGNDTATNESSALNRELVDKVRQNKTLLDIAKYLGRLKELIRHKRKNAFAYGRGEKYSLETGNSLQRILSSEFALLAVPETAPLFMRKLQRKGLKQYARRERICKGQGDIIVCLDESSSTRGDKSAWGKAVAYAMLEIAGINKRDFALIHFSGRGSFRTDLFRPGQYTQEDVFQSAATFLGGGTDYVTPLTEALRLMEENNYQRADLLFITDGECRLPEDFAQTLCGTKAARGFTIHGVLMDGFGADMAFSLKPFCDEITFISELGGERTADTLVGNRA